ncbi:MAG: helix-turn-helix transcriptional regulator [Clostridia bacterium]|nr:helix-turn-helix transcriptional regulator [Clostridia bacterium]
MRIGKTIKEIMQLLGISQIELAEKLGTTQTNISRRLSANMTLQTLEDIVSALGCRLEINIYLPNGNKF